MTLTFDLHTHSRASDGTLTPRQLIQHASKQGVDVLALTDHDDTSGHAEAQAEADRLGLHFIPGVEISVSWGQQTVHIVGLHVDGEHPELKQGLASLREFRHWRAAEIAQRLSKSGYGEAEAILAGARQYASGPIIGRTHFAHYLAAHGHAKSVRDVFKHFLVKGKPGYVSGEWTSLELAVGWIRAAGGEAVIAHPARYKMTATKLRRLMSEFIDVGGRGIEVVSGSHSRGDVFAMAQHSQRYGLQASCGSDYHGPENPWVEMGRLTPLPEHCSPIWAHWDLSQ